MMTISFYVIIGLLVFIILVPMIYNYTSKPKKQKSKADLKKKLTSPLQVLNPTPQSKLAWSTSERQHFAPPVYNENNTAHTHPNPTQMRQEPISNKSATKFEVLSSLDQGTGPVAPPTGTSQYTPTHPRNWRDNWH